MSSKNDDHDPQDQPEPEEGQNLIELLKPRDEWDEFEENRGSPRSRLVQVGELETGGAKFPCFVIDLSENGTKIRTLDPLRGKHSTVKLHIAEIGIFEAEVRWIRGTEVGLELNEVIETPEDHESASIEDVLRIQGAL